MKPRLLFRKNSAKTSSALETLATGFLRYHPFTDFPLFNKVNSYMGTDSVKVSQLISNNIYPFFVLGRELGILKRTGRQTNHINCGISFSIVQ